MKKNMLVILVAIFVSTCPRMAFADGAEVAGISIYHAGLLVLSMLGVFMFVVFLVFKWYVDKKAKKDNIAQLKMLIEKLFDNFYDLVREGGLFEEKWRPICEIEDAEYTWFEIKIRSARDILRSEKMKIRVGFFKEYADKVQKKGVFWEDIVKCEEAGFSLLTDLLGSGFARMDDLEWDTEIGNAPPWLKLVELRAFRNQLEKNRKLLLSKAKKGSVAERPGLLRHIIDMASAVEPVRNKIEKSYS